MKIKISIFLVFITAFTMFQCKHSSEKNIVNSKTDETLLKELPTDFLKFFNKFHTDTLFQLDHIVFPLEGATRSPESDIDSMIPYKWRKDRWQFHHKFDNYDNIFTRKFYMFDEKTIIEKISGVNGLFRMERRFAKLNNDWHLIYYSVN